MLMTEMDPTTQHHNTRLANMAVIACLVESGRSSLLTSDTDMGVDHGGTGETSPPPEFGAGGTLIQIVPPLDFVI